MIVVVFFFKQKTADEMRISDWSSDVCSSDLLAREGLVMNHKKLLRLYREENLRVRRRRGRKRAMGTRAMTLPQGPNQRWSLDFVSDTLISGRRIRILAVVDD